VRAGIVVISSESGRGCDRTGPGLHTRSAAVIDSYDIRHQLLLLGG